MSGHHDQTPQYGNHRRSEELHNSPSHVHDVAQQHGHQDHLTPHEQSRESHEHHIAHETASTEEAAANDFSHEEVTALAYELWQARGCPEGSQDEDWFAAVSQLRSRAR
jgi:hypothetical protein